jgi:hypothetical protein
LRGEGSAKRCDATTSWHKQRRGVKDGHVWRLRDERRREAEAHDNRRCDNQPANERQMGGESPMDKRQWGINRLRLRVKRRRQSQEDERLRHQRDKPPNERLPRRRQKRW